MMQGEFAQRKGNFCVPRRPLLLNMEGNFLAYFLVLYERDYAMALMLHAGRSQVRFTVASLEFFIDIVLMAALWPWDQVSI
jgi:hypothetical protein